MIPARCKNLENFQPERNYNKLQSGEAGMAEQVLTGLIPEKHVALKNEHSCKNIPALKNMLVMIIIQFACIFSLIFPQTNVDTFPREHEHMTSVHALSAES